MISKMAMMDVDLASSAYLWHCSRHIWLCLDFRKCRQDEVEGGEWGREKARARVLAALLQLHRVRNAVRCGGYLC